MMDAKLKECPHCGSAAILEDHRTVWAVECTSAACAAVMLGDRAPEPDSEMGDEYWDGIKQTAIDRWNARAIAPPVAARSVEDLQKILTGYALSYQRHSSGASLDNVIAWGAQQRQYGWDQCAILNQEAIRQQRERAEKAEAEQDTLKESLRLVNEDHGLWMARTHAAEDAREVALARVKELEVALTRIGPFNLTVD